MSYAMLSKEDINICLMESVSESAVKAFELSGYTNVECIPGTCSEAELIEKVRDVHFLGIRSRTHLTEKVINAASNLIAIGAYCIGTNQVDLKAAALNGIPVFNSPYSNTRSVAELVLAEAIMLLRDIPWKNAKLHEGKWDKKSETSYEIRGKKLGIIGYGNIGSQLSIMAESLGMRVYYYDVIPKLPLGNAMHVPILNKLLAECDVVSMHVPETQATKGMIGEKQFAMMKQGAVFINASRGSVVDIHALVAAIKSGHVKGAAIDVFPNEPHSNEERFVSPLCDFQNVILTPHIGGSTVEAQVNIGEDVSEKIMKYFELGSTLGAVNFPQIILPTTLGFHRLLHVHKNIPGVLTKLNTLFSENMINVGGQYMLTNDLIGYVVFDVEKEYTEFGARHFNKIEGTIRTRVIS